MPAPAYDIFKKGDAELIWVETAQDLQSAKTRIEELARRNGCEYVVYDQRAKRIVASHR
jgi:methionine synthase I (cobalamin-dependent)